MIARTLFFIVLCFSISAQAKTFPDAWCKDACKVVTQCDANLREIFLECTGPDNNTKQLTAIRGNLECPLSLPETGSRITHWESKCNDDGVCTYTGFVDATKQCPTIMHTDASFGDLNP